eukprot:5512586-Pleurochrysis_carterae.AAC.1
MSLHHSRFIKPSNSASLRICQSFALLQQSMPMDQTKLEEKRGNCKLSFISRRAKVASVFTSGPGTFSHTLTVSCPRLPRAGQGLLKL